MSSSYICCISLTMISSIIFESSAIYSITFMWLSWADSVGFLLLFETLDMHFSLLSDSRCFRLLLIRSMQDSFKWLSTSDFLSTVRWDLRIAGPVFMTAPLDPKSSDDLLSLSPWIWDWKTSLPCGHCWFYPCIQLEALPVKFPQFSIFDRLF